MKYTIIGAGIGGLTTALAFEKKGIDYQIYEKAPRISEVGAGIWLAPNALQVLDSLQVLDQVKLKGNSIDRITLAESDLSPLSDTDQSFIKNIFGYSTVAIHRAELQKVLFDAIPQEKIHLGKGFSSFKELEKHKIKVVFDDATETETDFLFGADGIHSKVRKQLFPASAIRFTGQTCWRGIVDYTLDPEFETRGMEFWGNQVRFGISKIAEGKVYWFAVALDKANQNDTGIVIKDKLAAMFSNFHPLCQQIIKATPENQIIRNDINDLKPLKNWHKGAVCLIGDAGHATTPNMGQGGAQAIEDAYYLAALIEKDSTQNSFQLFQNHRNKKVNAIVKQSWSTGKMAHWKYGKRFRNFLLKSIPKKTFQKKMLEMYTLQKIR